MTKEPQVKKASKEVQLQRENERLHAKMREQYILIRELAAFTQGVMLSEYVNGPHDKGGYDIGLLRVGGMVLASEKILLEP